MSNEQDQLISDLLNLKNEVKTVEKVEDNIFDFKSPSESKGWLGKVGVSFSSRALLDSDKKVVTYWDMIKKSSSGVGGVNMGFTSERYSVKGLERSGTGSVTVPDGEKV